MQPEQGFHAYAAQAQHPPRAPLAPRLLLQQQQQQQQQPMPAAAAQEQLQQLQYVPEHSQNVNHQQHLQSLPATGAFPYSFVGMQHSWAKAILPGYAGPANAASAFLRESESQTDRYAALDEDAIAKAKAAAIRARGASPVEELFDAVRLRELANAQQTQAEAIEAAQRHRMDDLEAQNERLKSALLRLRANFASLKEEIGTQNAKLDVLQEYAMTLEADNHTLRGQVAYMQQFFSNSNGYATSIPDETDSVTAQANGTSSFYFPGPTFERFDALEDRRLVSLGEKLVSHNSEGAHFSRPGEEVPYDPYANNGAYAGYERRDPYEDARLYTAETADRPSPSTGYSGLDDGSLAHLQQDRNNKAGHERSQSGEEDDEYHDYDNHDYDNADLYEEDAEDEGNLEGGDGEDDEETTDFRQYEDLEPTTALQLY